MIEIPPSYLIVRMLSDIIIPFFIKHFQFGRIAGIDVLNRNALNRLRHGRKHGRGKREGCQYSFHNS